MRVLRKLGAIAAVVALGLASTLSHAQLEVPAVSVVASPVALVTPGPGAQAVTTLTFEFLENYEFNSITLNVGYDQIFLTFNRSLSTVGLQGGNSVTLANAVMLLFTTGAPGEAVDSDTPLDGKYTLSGFTVKPSYPLPQGTKLVLTGVFDLTNSFNASTSTVVDMSVFVAGPLADPFQEDGFFGLQTTVTAVPEPETWMMLLGGLGLIASRIRRRSAPRASSEASPA